MPRRGAPVDCSWRPPVHRVLGCRPRRREWRVAAGGDGGPAAAQEPAPAVGARVGQGTTNPAHAAVGLHAHAKPSARGRWLRPDAQAQAEDLQRRIQAAEEAAAAASALAEERRAQIVKLEEDIAALYTAAAAGGRATAAGGQGGSAAGAGDADASPLPPLSDLVR